MRISSLLPSVVAACLSTVATAQVVPYEQGYEILHAGARYATFKAPLLGNQGAAVTVNSLPDDWYHVQLTWNQLAPIQQDDLNVDFAFNFDPDFDWVPHLTPIESTIVAQHAFRSPAIIASNGGRTVAIVPDLDLVGQSLAHPWYMDYDAVRGHAWIGMSWNLLPGHIIWVKAPGQTFAPGPVELSFFVKAYIDSSTPHNPWQEASKFLWKRWARPAIDAGQPHTNAMHKYVDTAYDWAFRRWEKQVWMDGGDVGAARFLVDFSESPTSGLPPVTARDPKIWNQAWYCSLRSAGGIMRMSQRNNDPDLYLRAKKTKNLALAAPTHDGIFPSVLFPMGTDQNDTFILNQSRWTNSDRSPDELGITRDYYHVLDASNTALWMIRWYRELEQDDALLDYATDYADWLLPKQFADGFFPAWLHPVTLDHAPVLCDSPETARSASFLIELADLTGDGAYLTAGLDALDAVLAGPAAEGRWEDFETYWSDNFFGTATNIGVKFTRNNLFKQNTLSIFWTAEACLAAYRATKDEAYLNWGIRTLDELSMSQQVWRPPYMGVPTVGGFGVMNADGEWNDARQSLFAELFMDYYVETGEPTYFERGVAALKISFAMMYTPMNPETKVQWEAAHPTLGPMDYGFTMENYGHWGLTGFQGEGIGFFSIFDWGCGSASEAYARITDHYGHVYIDRARNRAFGIDSIDVQPQGKGWLLTDLANTPRKIRVVDDVGPDRILWLDGTLVVQ